MYGIHILYYCVFCVGSVVPHWLTIATQGLVVTFKVLLVTPNDVVYGLLLTAADSVHGP